MPQDYFRALRDVALAINASLDPKDVLHKISEHTAQTMNCKACTIRLLDSTGHFLLPSAAYGLSATYMRKGPVEVKRSGLDSEVLSGKAIHLKDATSDGRFQYPESAKAEGLDRILAAAGFELRQPGCSACLAMNADKIPAGKYSVSTSNRNFEGRQGPGARTMLSGVAVAAAAAVTGVISDPREVFGMRDNNPE